MLKDSGYQPSCSLSSSMTEGSQSLVSESLSQSQLKATPSPSSLSDPDHHNKDFLIDDDYKDQPELTFCCQQEEEGNSIEVLVLVVTQMLPVLLILPCSDDIRLFKVSHLYCSDKRILV